MIIYVWLILVDIVVSVVVWASGSQVACESEYTASNVHLRHGMESATIMGFMMQLGT